MTRPSRGPMAHLWTLDHRLVHLNHGSFGACPHHVLAVQSRLRADLERDPTGFFLDACPLLWNQALDALASFLNTSPDGLTFQTNATAGVNTVLRNLALRPEDELLVTDHAYQACRNAVEAACARSGAEISVVNLPFPPTSEDEVFELMLAAAGPRTRLAMFETVTSPTGLRLPFERLTASFQARGIDVLLDASHGPGIVELDLNALDAAYVTGTCHKWLHTPKGSGFLFVREDRRAALEPLIVSHGYSAPLSGSAKFRELFDWPGTQDPTPWLCIPTALEYVAREFTGGWSGVLEHGRQLARGAQEVLAKSLGIERRVPHSMLAALATLPLPRGNAPSAPTAFTTDPLARVLLEKFGIRVMVFDWPMHRTRYLRVSAAPYNTAEEYAYLAEVLTTLGIGEHAYA